MKKFILFFSVLAALICSSCVKPEPDIWGSISGVVKDAQSNQPIEGVKVTVTATGASQITNSDGQFTFDNLDATEYSLSFEKTGYFSHTQKVTVLAGETATAQVQLKKNLLGIDVTPNVLDFGTGSSSMNLTVTAQSGTVRFTATSNASWLSVSPNSASVSTSTVLQVLVTRGSLSPGTYDGAITITANGESLTVPVYMQVSGGSQPVISVESVTGVTQTTATVNGVLTLENGVSVSDYGICYSTNATPTVNDAKISRGGTSTSTSYSCQLGGLNPGTEYYVRAYAVSGGQTYYGNIKSFTTSTQGGGGGGGGGSEDYSSATLRSTNDLIVIGLTSCKRQASGNVLMETTILNTGIQEYGDFRVRGVGEGQSWDGKNWITTISDPLYTDYGFYDLYMSLAGKSGNRLGGGVVVPIDQTKKFSITIKNVPQDATSISVHLSTYFYGYQCEYSYLTYDNVPIY